MKFYFFIILVVAFANPSWAVSRLDHSVSDFITKNLNDTEKTLRVLIRYQVSVIQNNLKPIEAQKKLIQNTKHFENLVFSKVHIQKQNLNLFSLWVLQGSIASLNAEALQQIQNLNEVASITALNRKAHLVQDTIETQSITDQFDSLRYTYGLEKINLPALNLKYPELNGAGVKVGIIDTGLNANHPDLKNKMILFKDFINNKTLAYDDHGHGTHVAGTIAGGQASAQAIGVASAANLIIAKSFNLRGSSSDEGLLKSMQWMADPDENPQTQDYPQIISNSWNVDGNSFSTKNPEDEPFCVLIQNLNRLQIAVVFAAGNDGPGNSSVLVPGACPEAITVGATTSSDAIASFSSRGPIQWKSETVIKPNISAPGKDINSADKGGGYKTRSGTSMATPHIAGVLALMYQAKPELNLEEAKNFLYLGAKDLGSLGLDNTFGFGRADVLNSIELMKK